jgi:glucose-1-phosphate adenylyltransferase
MRYLPASRINAAHLEECLISDGCVVQSGSRIKHSVLGIRTVIGNNVQLTNAVIIGADRYETENERAENRRRGIPDLGIGEGTIIENAIVDKDCRIGRNVKIVNHKKAIDEEGENYVIKEGVVVIPKGAVVTDETVI